MLTKLIHHFLYALLLQFLYNLKVPYNCSFLQIDCTQTDSGFICPKFDILYTNNDSNFSQISWHDYIFIPQI